MFSLTENKISSGKEMAEVLLQRQEQEKLFPSHERLVEM